MSTEQNLLAAFAGESQANRRYTAFGRKAEADGWAQVARLFRGIAEAETVHALNEFGVADGVKSTPENLQTAMAGEYYEYTEMYPNFTAEAKQDGNLKAEVTFRRTRTVEELHYNLYKGAFESVSSGKDLPAASVYICPVCGHTVVGGLPDKCPVCDTRKDRYFEVK
jgi:rubrerythrin